MTVGKFFAVAGATFALLLLVLMTSPYRNETDADRIARVCREDYGGQGSEAVAECRTSMMARTLIDRRNEQRDSTYSRVKPF
jgi:hypothetical protein